MSMDPQISGHLSFDPASIPGQLFIGGQWRPGKGGGDIDVIDPSTGSVIGRVADASVDDAMDAVAAARSEVSLTYNFTPYVVAGILFVLLAIPTIRVADWYTAKLQRREQAGSVL